MGDQFDYHEVVIHTCTGDTNVLMFDGGDPACSRRNADQAASILRVIARSGQDVERIRNGHSDDWFKAFPDMAHVIFVAVASRNHISGDTFPYRSHSFWCEHTQMKESI